MKSVDHKNILFPHNPLLCNLGRFGEGSNIDTIGVFPASQVLHKHNIPHRSGFQTQFCSNLQTKPFSRTFRTSLFTFLEFPRIFRMFTKFSKSERASQPKSKVARFNKTSLRKVKSSGFYILLSSR